MVENVELDDIAQRINGTVGDIMRDTDETGLLPLRELKGLDHTLRTISGSLAVQASKNAAMQHKESYQEKIEECD